VWLWFYDKATLSSWSLPVSYSGDSLEAFARIKAAAEGDWLPFQTHLITRLGAPFGANWNTYAEADLPLFALLGWLSRHLGLFETANLALLLAHVGAALAFYGVARIFRARIEWAAAGAALYACSNYFFFRSFAHSHRWRASSRLPPATSHVVARASGTVQASTSEKCAKLRKKK